MLFLLGSLPWPSCPCFTLLAIIPHMGGAPGSTSYMSWEGRDLSACLAKTQHNVYTTWQVLEKPSMSERMKE